MLQKPRGTRDFLPEEMEARRSIEANLLEIARRWEELQKKAPRTAKAPAMRSKPRKPASSDRTLPILRFH
jgi:histidyl-tRNA synthetase